MFCSNCGSKIEDGALFCSNCGARTENEECPEQVSSGEDVTDQQDESVSDSRNPDSRSVSLFVGCVILYTLSVVDFALSWYGVDITGFRYSPYVFAGLGALCQYLRKSLYGEQAFGKFEAYAIGVIASIGVIAAVIGGACFREPSTRDVEKQAVELLTGAINEDDVLSQHVKVEKVEGLTLFKKERNHYVGSAYVWLQRKVSPSKRPVRFKYEVVVTLSSGGALLESNAADPESLSEYILLLDETDEEDTEEALVEAVDDCTNETDVDYGHITVREGEKVVAEWNEALSGTQTSVQTSRKLMQMKGRKIAISGGVQNVTTLHLLLSQITKETGLYVTITNKMTQDNPFGIIVQMSSPSDKVAESLRPGEPVVAYGRMFDWPELTDETIGLLPALALSHGRIVRQKPDPDGGASRTTIGGVGDGVEDEQDEAMVGCNREIPDKCFTDARVDEYASILREAMPVVMAMQGVPKGKIESTAAQAIEKELKRFRESSDEDKEKSLGEARESLPKIRALKKGGPEAKAIIKKANDSAESAALAMRGRQLFMAIMAAGVEREMAGLDDVWPKTRLTKSNNSKDISGRLFANSTEYFKALFDGKNPYVKGVDVSIALSDETKTANWIVAQGVVDEMADCVPVLVSANVDRDSLLMRPGRHDASEMRGRLRFSGSYAVVVRKGGFVQVIKSTDPSLANVYGRGDFTLPQGFSYLPPTGAMPEDVPPSNAVETTVSPAASKADKTGRQLNSVAGLAHRWSFDGSLMDAVGGIAAKKVGNVVSDGKQYSTHGGGNGASFIDLGSFGEIAQTAPITLEMWITRHACSAWAGGRTLSIGTIPTDGNFLQIVDDHLDIVVNNKAYTLNIGSSPNDRECYIALTFSACQGGWAATGLKIDAQTGSLVRQSQVLITAGDPIRAFAHGKLLLAKALTTLGQDGDGKIDFKEFRVWNRALDYDTLKFNARNGPDMILPASDKKIEGSEEESME